MAVSKSEGALQVWAQEPCVLQKIAEGIWKNVSPNDVMVTTCPIGTLGVWEERSVERERRRAYDYLHSL